MTLGHCVMEIYGSCFMNIQPLSLSFLYRHVSMMHCFFTLSDMRLTSPLASMKHLGRGKDMFLIPV
jgi:hypothetical protein